MHLGRLERPAHPSDDHLADLDRLVHSARERQCLDQERSRLPVPEPVGPAERVDGRRQRAPLDR
jgi:hypothetical protein